MTTLSELDRMCAELNAITDTPEVRRAEEQKKQRRVMENAQAAKRIISDLDKLANMFTDEEREQLKQASAVFSNLDERFGLLAGKERSDVVRTAFDNAGREAE